MNKLLLTLALFFSLAQQAQATIFAFDLVGTAGSGLLFGNEPAVASGGTGGEIGTGITFDDALNLLTVNVGWGSSQGFTDLSSLANNSHIHGPTAAANGSGFTQTAGVLFTLNRSSNAVTGGFFTSPSNTVTLTAAQKIDLFDGKYYINIHTANNGGGELRGFIVAVPEPETYAMLLAGLALVGAIARRRTRMGGESGQSSPHGAFQ